ncbi:YlzJ-like family protein [Radiobacillus kanasensis]|uniref:YlzJ-like family protein n=1 Tax=Radiobacillus kanasensis TaxID=2844358 RepID=UPI001E46C513|nr:YlzJ-like family protein [Radiobacillus kanasensis]UFU01089.1 YlzJ-like family protein [Radiobacillus kanasensis]
MILYTPLSQEDIFPEDQKSYLGQEIVQVDGKAVCAKKREDGSYEVIQLLSTNPNDFLVQNFQPGSIFTTNDAR